MTDFADGLLERAYRSLDKAASAKTPNAIYVAAFLAASNAAAAIVSAKITPDQARNMTRPGSLWAALTIADPDLCDWAHHFASRGPRRDLADKNVPDAICRDQAEQLLQDVNQFIVTAEGIVQKEAS